METAYVLVTAAKNEDAYIENLIKSVVSQTILPIRWIIVSDGSTDKTNEIVLSYAKQYSLIELIALEAYKKRNFGSQAKAFNYGCQQIKNTQYKFIGNLDADLTFGPDYYETLLRKFNANPRLGITGGIITELKKGTWKVRAEDSKTFVAGALQFFCKECFEQVGGGYHEAMSDGGYDAVAYALARINGWQVEAASELPVHHYRPTGTAIKNVFHANYQSGKRDYLMGKPLLFVSLKSIWRFRYKPYIIGGSLRLAGYFSCIIRGIKPPVPKEVLNYFRNDQFGTIFKKFSSL